MDWGEAVAPLRHRRQTLVPLYDSVLEFPSVWIVTRRLHGVLEHQGMTLEESVGDELWAVSLEAWVLLQGFPHRASRQFWVNLH